jgi:hypothetical protein
MTLSKRRTGRNIGAAVSPLRATCSIIPTSSQIVPSSISVAAPDSSPSPPPKLERAASPPSTRSCAITATELNAAANNVAIATTCANILSGDPPATDIVLAGDLFYESDLAERVIAFFDRCLTANIEILVGDPWRASLPRERLELIAEYPGLDFGDTPTATRMNAVFRFVARE